MAGHQDHQHWVKAGLRQHEARSYAKALVLFRKAQRMAPECPVTAYNHANTLHMLDRDDEAASILQTLISVDPDILAARCSGVDGRSLQLDALYLLFLVSVHGQGFSAEAFHYAEEHLRRRRRGLRSAWSLREVRAEIASLRREWEGTG
jgi:tetratricopeptide (TPR) repeat protein